MHMTVTEIAFSLKPDQVDTLVARLRPSMAPILNYTFTNRSRLVKPVISHDLSAFALSFLPAAGEAPLCPPSPAPLSTGGVVEGDEYTYHHLRRDVAAIIEGTGIRVESRYQVPSAHITLGRFIIQDDHVTSVKRERWTKAVDRINEWLEKEVWDIKNAEYTGEWVIGQEKGLELRSGLLWYGGGRTIMTGEGF